MFHAKVADQSLASVQLRFQSLLSLPRPAWNRGTDGMRKRSRQPSDSSVVFHRLLLALISVCSTTLSHVSVASDAPFAPPFYFSAPRSAWGEQPALHPGGVDEIDALLLEAGSKGLPTVPAGLRYILVRDAKDVRDSIARALYAKGLLADGDVVLTFRPGWADTMAYPHIQMGISHSGIIHTRGGRAYNLDMPLDEEHNGGSFDSELNSRHYKDATALHILRPRHFGTPERDSFRALVDELLRNVGVIRNRALLPFNKDYLTPRYFALHISPTESVTRFRSIVTSPETVRSPMKMYCSEFVWHMHSLNGLEKADHRLIFDPMKFVSTDGATGMGEGPLAVLKSAGENLTTDQKSRLIQAMFVDNEAPQLSTGHRETARKVKPLMGQLERYYQTQLLGAASEKDISESGPELAKAINESMPANYSPTAFFINSFLPPDHPERQFDYLYTLLYVSSSDFEQVRAAIAAR